MHAWIWRDVRSGFLIIIFYQDWDLCPGCSSAADACRRPAHQPGMATGVPATRVNTTEFMGLRVNNGTCRAWQLHVQAYNFHEVHVSEL